MVGHALTPAGSAGADVRLDVDAPPGWGVAARYSPYGSTTPKQLYVYGGLDRAATTLSRNYGMSWGVGGWLVGNTLAKLDAGAVTALRTRVANELGTTFASHYAKRITLRELLDLEVARRYAKMATSEKYLVVPT